MICQGLWGCVIMSTKEFARMVSIQFKRLIQGPCLSCSLEVMQAVEGEGQGIIYLPLNFATKGTSRLNSSTW